VEAENLAPQNVDIQRGVVTAGATGYRREARGFDGLWLVREQLVDAA
jgi:hypothetical protein